MKNTLLLAASALALATLSACSSEPEEAPVEANAIDQVVEEPAAEPAVEPEATPSPTPTSEPTSEAASVDEETQMLEDADAVGMTARLPRDEGSAPANQSEQQ